MYFCIFFILDLVFNLIFKFLLILSNLMFSLKIMALLYFNYLFLVF